GLSDFILRLYYYYRKKVKLEEILNDHKTAREIHLAQQILNEILRSLDYATLTGRAANCDELYFKIEVVEKMVKDILNSSSSCK
ncbi:MAG: hypothetical protein ACK5PC_08010, partial [Cyclobacteriaceae bacterium]